MKKVVLLTGNELRHDFFRKFIACDKEINVLASFCESAKGNLGQLVSKEENNLLRLTHLAERVAIEDDFFGLFCQNIQDKSNPFFIDRGKINDEEIIDHITRLQPDLIIAYGCSIIKSRLLSLLHRKFINIHLGLSPYYRGAGTNFWPFVNKELQFVGTTFMHIDAGIDTGEIIHQIRADIYHHDNIHQIGNRLIKNSFVACKKIIKNFDALDVMTPIDFKKANEHYYTKKDFTENSLKIAYRNMAEGLVENYLSDKITTDVKYPIITNSYFATV